MTQKKQSAPVKQALSVGEVAKRTGVAVSALHFYEEKGLIRSSRNAGNQRRYAREVLRRVAMIKAAQKVGIRLSDIERLFAQLPDGQPLTQHDWQRMAQQWQASLQDHMQYLQRLSDHLSGCIGCGCLSLDKCPLYNANDHAATQGTGAVFVNQKS